MEKRSCKINRLMVGLLTVLAWAFMLFINGAVPFLASPTLGQAVWTTGFALSFIQDSLLSIHATNFGNPNPASIAFGLAGAYPTGILISLGLHPADAYTFMVAIWLTVAFYGAWRIGSFLGLSPALTSLGALLWTSTPVIWAHAGYSMVSLGIAMLPFYFSVVINFLFKIVNKVRFSFKSVIGYFIVSIIAVFMDGYTFMMFAFGSSILGCYILIQYKESRPYLIKRAIPIHALSFSLAYGLYALYIGKASYNPAPLDFFRGWGLDLSFIAVPTRGILWLWDTLGLSVSRSDAQFFGDGSVWITTFSLPLIIMGIIAWLLTRKGSRLATYFLIIALLGFYMALGPSLKINSTKPDSLQIERPNQMSALMPSNLAVAPTGNEILFEHVPGFNNMRAVYRWSALGMFGFWALILLLLVQKRSSNARYIVIVTIGFLILNNLPNLSHQWQVYQNNRSMFLQIDNDLVKPLSQELRPGEKVAFLPYRNDFLVNYLAPTLGIQTFNIGGDKNLEEARKNWPEIMQGFKMGQLDPGFSGRIALLLTEGEATAVVLPYFDMLLAAHYWPIENCYQTEFEPILQEIEAYKLFEVDPSQQYALIRLKPLYNAQAGSSTLSAILLSEMKRLPSNLKIVDFPFDFTFHQVGRVENGAIYTTGETGFLCYGPYVSLNSGQYRLTVEGEASFVDNAWVDVVSHKGTHQYAKFPLSTTSSDSSNVLASGELTINEYVEDIEDIEVRIYVSASDTMRLDKYELVQIKPKDKK